MRKGVDLRANNHIKVAMPYTAKATINFVLNKLAAKPAGDHTIVAEANLNRICPAESANTVNTIKNNCAIAIVVHPFEDSAIIGVEGPASVGYNPGHLCCNRRGAPNCCAVAS